MYVIKDKGITVKFLLYFTIMVVMPVMLINILAINAYRNILVDNARDGIRQQQASVAGNLDSELSTYNRILAAIVYNSKSVVLEDVTNIHRASDPQNKYDLTESMDEKIQLIMHASNNIDGVYFIFDDAGYYYYNNPLATSVASVKELQLYSDSLLNPDKTQKGRLTNGLTTDSNERYTLLFGVHPSVSDFRNDVDVVLLSAFTDVLPRNSDASVNTQHGRMYIIDHEGIIMFSEEKDHEGSNVREIDGLEDLMSVDSTSYMTGIGGDDMLVNIYEMEGAGWKIINLVSKEYVTRQADLVMTISLYINLAIVLCFFLFTVFFFRGMIKPINELIHGMRLVEQGHLDHRLALVGNKEIQLLSRAFNTMASRLTRLIEENQRKEREKMVAEMDALQSQINPHFIVNNLSTIKFMAMVSKNHNIQRVSEMLMNILNTSFRHRDHYNRVSDELALVKSYIEIMLIRYGNDFDVRYEVEEAILERKILKLILQPIVENSITHGLSEKEGRKHLVIKAGIKEDKLIFEVIDNGCGMTAEQLEKAYTERKDEMSGIRHIGISNIQNRLILNHGHDFGMTIKSKEGCFTKVTLTLPLTDQIGKEGPS